MQTKNSQLVIFSEKLTDLIKRRGLSQKAVAEAVGLTPTAVSYYVNGERMPGSGELFKIAEFFGVSMETLINDDSVLHDSTGQTGESIRPLLASIGRNLDVMMAQVEDVTSEFNELCVRLGVDPSQFLLVTYSKDRKRSARLNKVVGK